MSHTNSTTNYNLPQFLTTDKPAWLTDVNNAYLAIDTAMKNNADAASTADTKATNAGTAATNADTKATNAKSAADGAIASIADTFSDTNTYVVDDIVMYNSLLYKCTTAVTTPGAWTGSANWERTTVEDILDTKADTSDIPTNVSQLTNDAGYLTVGTTPVVRYYNAWGTSLSTTVSRGHWLIISSDVLFIAWLAGVNEVNLINVNTGASASGTGSATLGHLTVTRNDLKIIATATSNRTLTIIG